MAWSLRSWRRAARKESLRHDDGVSILLIFRVRITLPHVFTSSRLDEYTTKAAVLAFMLRFVASSYLNLSLYHMFN